MRYRTGASPTLNKLLMTVAVFLSLGRIGWGQSVEISPPELSRVPVTGLVDGRYWQQLVITLDQADAASDSAISVALPLGTSVLDLDLDGRIDDEVRVVYRAVGSERPGLAASSSSSSGQLVVGSRNP
ncbi:MAG: hypothetical protein WDA75_25260, partial [Candidatus Latescibacterota bacterium]